MWDPYGQTLAAAGNMQDAQRIQQIANLKRMQQLYAAEQAAQQQAQIQALARTPNPDGSPRDMNVSPPETQGPPAPEAEVTRPEPGIEQLPDSVRENMGGYDSRRAMIEKLRAEQDRPPAPPPPVQAATGSVPNRPTPNNYPAQQRPPVPNAPTPDNYPKPERVPDRTGMTPAPLNPYGNAARPGDNPGAGGPGALVTAAKGNVTKEPEGFMGRLKNWMGQIGQVFDPASGGEDPGAINPQYGVPNSQVWQAQRAALFNAGVLLMAAGQPNTPEMRAKLIASMGPTLSNVSKDIYNTAQAQLMNAQANRPGGGRPYVVRTYKDKSTGREMQEWSTGERKAVGSTPPTQEAYSTMAKVWVGGDTDKPSYARAQLMAANVRRADEAMSLISPDMISGTGTGARTAWLRFKNTAGRALGMNPDEIGDDMETRRDILKSYVINMVLPKMAMLGGSDSNEELAQLRQSIVGDNWSAQTIMESLGNIREADTRDLAQLNQQRAEMKDFLPETMRGEVPMPDLLVPRGKYATRYKAKDRMEQYGDPQGGAGGTGGNTARDTKGTVTLPEAKLKVLQERLKDQPDNKPIDTSAGRLMKTKGRIYREVNGTWKLIKAQ